MSRTKRRNQDLVLLRVNTVALVADAYAAQGCNVSTVVRDALVLELAHFRDRVHRTLDVAELVATFRWERTTAGRSLRRLHAAGLLREGKPVGDAPEGYVLELPIQQLHRGKSLFDAAVRALVKRPPARCAEYGGGWTEIGANEVVRAFRCSMHAAQEALLRVAGQLASGVERTCKRGRKALFRVLARRVVRERQRQAAAQARERAAAAPDALDEARSKGPPSTAPPSLDALLDVMRGSRKHSTT